MAQRFINVVVVKFETDGRLSASTIEYAVETALGRLRLRCPPNTGFALVDRDTVDASLVWRIKAS